MVGTSVEWSTPVSLSVGHHLLFFLSTARTPLSSLIVSLVNSLILEFLPKLLLAYITALFCLFPSARVSGALGNWGIGARSRRCFCPFSVLLSVTLQYMLPVCITQRKPMSFSSALNVTQNGGVLCLLGIIGLNVCFSELKWIIRIYHEKWYICHCTSRQVWGFFIILKSSCMSQ